MKRLYKHYVRMCRRKNVFWELSVEQFHKLTSAPCIYCEKPPLQISRAYKYNGIDRLDPKRGYVPANVAPCCKECNWIKGDRLTSEEMKVVGQALTTFRNRVKRS
jgi:hypothetical protein